MSFSVSMPALGESVTEGTVTRWLKQEGDRVERDEPLLEVSTDKVDTEIPSPVAGVLTRIIVAIDQTVEVGAELAVIDDGSGESDQSAPAQSAPAMKASPPEPPAEQASAAPEPATPAAPTAKASSNDQGTVVVMPALGESVSEGTVTRWLKNVGDDVAADEPLLEVSTDKVDTEIPSPVSGKLLSIDVEIDSTVAVGARLAMIGSSSATPKPAAPVTQAPPAPKPAPPASAPTQQPPAPAQQAPAPAQSAPAAPAAPAFAAQESDGDSYVTPLVRKLAAENGIDLSTITGTGVGGRIRKQDVLEAAARKSAAPTTTASPAPAPAAKAPAAKATEATSALRGTTEKMSRLRQVIATRMVESLQTTAQLTTVIEVDLTKVARLRDRAKKSFEEREGVKLTFLPFIAVAVVDALKQHPKLNASVEGDQVTYHGAEHLAVAVDTERGLLVPVVRDAGDLNMAGLARKIADVAARTRENKITPDELSGGTFTITNTGSRGALFDTPIVNQPQVAILGTGAIVKRPVVVADVDGGETIAVRSMMYLALSYDHRLVDGADAARFLTTLKERLEEGNFESEIGL
jgi:pyruvate dehydrogenase E2 component (dihydrolipoamide acetyltransferase)